MDVCVCVCVAVRSSQIDLPSFAFIILSIFFFSRIEFLEAFGVRFAITAYLCVCECVLSLFSFVVGFNSI